MSFLKRAATFAGLSSLVLAAGACRPAAPPRTTTTAGHIEAPDFRVTMPELARPSEKAADPRRDVADKASLAALMAWMPNDANAVMVCAKPTTAPMDKLLWPLRDVLPAELFALVTGVHTLPAAMRSVAGDGLADGLVLVRAEGTGPDATKSGVLFVPKGTKHLAKGPGTRRVSGLAAKDNAVLSMESWTELALDDTHAALVPRARVDAFATAVTGRKTGQPAALKGAEPQLGASLVAEAWVAPTGAGTMDGFGVAFADLRLEETPSGDLAMHLVLTAALGDQDKLAKALQDAVRKAEGGDYRHARVVSGENNTVTLDVPFGAR